MKLIYEFDEIKLINTGRKDMNGACEFVIFYKKGDIEIHQLKHPIYLDNEKELERFKIMWRGEEGNSHD